MTDRRVARETVTMAKACEIVHVSRRTIYNWIAAHKIEVEHTAGGGVRIYKDSLWKAQAPKPETW